MTQELIIACYTAGDYEQEAREKLLPSLQRLDLPHVVRQVPNRGSWIGNGFACQLFIRAMHDERPEADFLFMDVDVTIHCDPWPFLRMNKPCDLGVHYFDNREMLTGTLYLPAGPRRREILTRWIQLNRANPGVWDQKNLQAMVAIDSSIKVFRLPPEYCCITDLQRKRTPHIIPIIEHFQASRRFKHRVEPVEGPKSLSEPTGAQGLVLNQLEGSKGPLGASVPPPSPVPGPVEGITAVVPTFQYAHYLPATLKSLLAQREPCKIIIVPVAGDTASLEIAHKFAEDYPSDVKVVVSKYAAIPHQMNLGFSHVQTSHAFFAGSDDIWLPETTYLYRKYADEQGAVVVYPNIMMGNSLAQPLNRIPRNIQKETKFTYEALLKSCFITDCSLVHVDTFRRYLPMTLASHHHFIYDVWKKVGKNHGDRIVHMPEPAFIYRQHSDSESNQVRRKGFTQFHPVVVGRPPGIPGWNVVPPVRWNHRSVVYSSDPKLLLDLSPQWRFHKVLLRSDDSLPVGLRNVVALRSADLQAHNLEWWLFNDVYPGLGEQG